ncbi:hypothetical protein [Oryza sativa Japonica Group]|uniref:Uncharacterized protein n=1 Tax=Oryza sativa subsp. japonica TaxID=39947 RepID=Q5JJY6_ORYSJ|nr:hypothetical protein [Oryza sativa Japonica Group]BAD88222.1 hypothetical protein [Oryza sativa Japonica Group]
MEMLLILSLARMSRMVLAWVGRERGGERGGRRAGREGKAAVGEEPRHHLWVTLTAGLLEFSTKALM